MSGLLGGADVDTEAKELLETDADDYTWAAAAIGAQNAASHQLATGEPVMAIGGFNGTDPSPTLAQFQQYMKDGKIHYFVSGGGSRLPRDAMHALSPHRAQSRVHPVRGSTPGTPGART